MASQKEKVEFKTVRINSWYPDSKNIEKPMKNRAKYSKPNIPHHNLYTSHWPWSHYYIRAEFSNWHLGWGEKGIENRKQGGKWHPTSKWVEKAETHSHRESGPAPTRSSIVPHNQDGTSNSQLLTQEQSLVSTSSTTTFKACTTGKDPKTPSSER